MSEQVYETMEITGSSPNSIEEAINGALANVTNSERDMRWYEVTNTRGNIINGKAGSFQVTLKVGFVSENSKAVAQES